MKDKPANTDLSPSQGDQRGFSYTSSPVLIGQTPLGGIQPYPYPVDDKYRYTRYKSISGTMHQDH